MRTFSVPSSDDFSFFVVPIHPSHFVTAPQGAYPPSASLQSGGSVLDILRISPNSATSSDEDLILMMWSPDVFFVLPFSPSHFVTASQGAYPPSALLQSGVVVEYIGCLCHERLST